MFASIILIGTQPGIAIIVTSPFAKTARWFCRITFFAAKHAGTDFY